MKKLYYVVDPMCSWCYGFSPEFDKVVESLPEDIELHYIMGGLAPDSDEPMNESTKQYIRHHWETVASNTGQHSIMIFGANFLKCGPSSGVITTRLAGKDPDQ